jgi:hypothetical protein
MLSRISTTKFAIGFETRGQLPADSVPRLARARLFEDVKLLNMRVCEKEAQDTHCGAVPIGLAAGRTLSRPKVVSKGRPSGEYDGILPHSLGMPLSMQGHHALRDGVHVGKLYAQGPDHFRNPSAVLGEP